MDPYQINKHLKIKDGPELQIFRSYTLGADERNHYTFNPFACHWCTKYERTIPHLTQILFIVQFKMTNQIVEIFKVPKWSVQT